LVSALTCPPRRLDRLPVDLVGSLSDCLDATVVGPLAWAWAEKLRRFVELPGGRLAAVAADRFGRASWREAIGRACLLLAKAAAAGQGASTEGLPDLAYLNAALRSLDVAGGVEASHWEAAALVERSLTTARLVIAKRRATSSDQDEVALPREVDTERFPDVASAPFRVVVMGRPDSLYTAICLHLLRKAGVTVAGMIAAIGPPKRRLAHHVRTCLRPATLVRWLDLLSGHVRGNPGKSAAMAALLRLARELGLGAAPGPLDHNPTLVKVASLDDPRVLGLLERTRPDAVVYGGGGLVRPSVIARAGRGVVNAHNAVLPGYRGLDAPAWALLEGRLDRIGLTGHLMDEGVDTGPVLCVRRVDPAAFASPSALDMQLWSALPGVLVEATVALRDGVMAEPQLTVARQYFRLHPRLRPLVTSALSAVARQL
jgi:hypothetical protein